MDRNGLQPVLRQSIHREGHQFMPYMVKVACDVICHNGTSSNQAPHVIAHIVEMFNKVLWLSMMVLPDHNPPIKAMLEACGLEGKVKVDVPSDEWFRQQRLVAGIHHPLLQYHLRHPSHR